MMIMKTLLRPYRNNSQLFINQLKSQMLNSIGVREKRDNIKKSILTNPANANKQKHKKIQSELTPIKNSY